MKKIDGVESAEVSLNEGLARIRLKPGNSIRLADIRAKVEENGFTPKEAIVVARGQIVSADGRDQFRVSGTNETFGLSVDPKVTHLREEIRKQTGQTVVLDGVAAPPDPPKAKTPAVIQVKAVRPAT